MDDLKRYILENRSGFEDEPVPVGSRERFMVKAVRAEKRRVWIWTVPAAAAVLAVLFAVSGQNRDRDADYLERLLLEMTRSEIEIMALVETNFPQDVEAVGNTLRSITTEAIPLAYLLPDEMPDMERMDVLKEYYVRKAEAIKRVKQYYENEIKEL